VTPRPLFERPCAEGIGKGFILPNYDAGPGDRFVMIVAEAPNPELVKEVNQAAQIPFERVVEAMDLTP